MRAGPHGIAGMSTCCPSALCENQPWTDLDVEVSDTSVSYYVVREVRHSCCRRKATGYLPCLMFNQRACHLLPH